MPDSKDLAQATPDQLERARKAAAAYWQTGDVGDESSARSILSGEWDDMAYTQAALTAILEADQQQTDLLRHAEAMVGALRLIRHQWAGHAEECAYVKSAYKAKCDCDWPMVAERCDTATNAFREWQGGGVMGSLGLCDHTPHPEGYVQWHAWAKAMAKTHRQIRCSECGYYAIWVPKMKDSTNA